ncbi:hypothetical protein [Mesorhizobium huakuii]|uniref:Uncharacterized protein n=1 Tax=Mesorhizobium huakuii TaxID=28104 RepID=A0ABZ0W428_9HYPH|nr:hypothetical protein [Mesorhizobium huakuii]WQC02737.1 hypothetical protein U0R22_006992 [Mesorhizobium huakuii]
MNPITATELTAVWILPEDLDLALSLSDAMRHQIDIHKRESKKVGAHHGWAITLRQRHRS